ncbi:MAG: HipA domain-containing protein [Pseudomonadota bacterium]
MMTSKPLYVYLQRPDNAEWVTAGRYLFDAVSKIGKFRYAPSYITAGLPWPIDPVNLLLLPDFDYIAPRYGGLHDVLRDASPDAWGKLLLKREHALPDHAHESRYLALASNVDRWGALAIGTSRQPPASRIMSPKPPDLEALTRELLAIAEHRPTTDAGLRRRLVATPSLGGARPKATIRSGQDFWLVKPRLATDTIDVPLLEHMAQQWGSLIGLNFARSELHRLTDGWSVIRILRFDRDGEQRHMAVSGATLLQTEYPSGKLDQASHWSYPRLAEELRRIGAPDSDRVELFGRMVFNAVIGNDDDHPKNHAVIYDHQARTWRLSPAFDVVPNPDQTPDYLTLQVSLGSNRIERGALLGDAKRFSFKSTEDGAAYLDALLARIASTYPVVAPLLPAELQHMMQQRIASNIRLLATPD